MFPLFVLAAFFPQAAHAETCPQNGRSPLWAQIRLDSDLASLELEQLRKSEPTAVAPISVTILDSGFDKSQKGNLKATSLTVLNGMSGSDKNPDLDPEGHGTSIVSLIAGDHFIGSGANPTINVLAITEREANQHSHASPSLFKSTADPIVDAIKSACGQGADVVNLSWEELKNPIVDDELIEALIEAPCLIVQASGNRARLALKTKKQESEKVLHVQASTPFFDSAKFSEHGEVAAPGVQILALRSAQKRVTPGLTCGKSYAEHFVTGTSYSAALVSGIAATAISVLKADPIYSALKPHGRNTLVSKIVDASHRFGNVNALRAFWMARAWTRLKKEQKSQPATLDGLKKLLPSSQDPLCTQKPSGIIAERQHVALCAKPLIPTLQSLLATAQRSNELELAALALLWFKELKTKPAIDAGFWKTFVHFSKKTDRVRLKKYYLLHQRITGYKSLALEKRLRR